jgi:beta-N-acetylhexosaminidase
VAERVGAAVQALGAARVGATPKHFPGLGAAAANTDDAPVSIAAEDLEADLAPFRAAFAAGAPLVMVGHARYPALDGERIASQSPAVLRDLLRERLGFRGVAVTDSLEAAAVPQEPGAAAVASVAAGVDLVLTTGAGSHLDVVRALLRRARASAAFRARVAEAAARVEALRRELGLAAPQ